VRKIDPLIAKPIPDIDFINSFPPRFIKNTTVYKINIL
jgi:hypothetical protein